MKKASWPVLTLTLGLLMALLGTPAGGLAQPASLRARPAAIQSPILDPLMDIWVDGLQNAAPTVAYNSRHDEYLVVWYTQQGAYTYDIWARRVGGDGNLGNWFNVATGPGQARLDPVVAYSPVQDEYLIVYVYEVDASNYDLRAQRVSWDGGGGWSSEFVINDDSGSQWNPAVAYNSVDDEYLVVYQNLRAGGLQDIAAQRVKASDGSLPSWANVATGAGEDRTVPDVAYNEARNQYLIAYTYEAGAGSDSHIYGKVAAADLAGVGSSSEIPICADSNDQDYVAVAAGLDEYMVVWHQGMGPFGGVDVFARRVDGDGTPQGGSSGFEIAGSGSSQYHGASAVAYGAGYGYLVTWMYDAGSSVYDVYGRYVMPGKDSAAGDPFTIVGTAHSQEKPAVACAPSGDCLVIEEDNWAAGGADDYEIRGRFVRPYHVYLPLLLRSYP